MSRAELGPAGVYHRVVVYLLFAILLLPLAGTLVYSIASSWSATILPSGFTLKWYIQLWSDPRFLHAFGQSLLVCVGSLILSVVLILPLLFVVHYHFPKLDALREDWRESAALLGADGWQYWRHIGLPVLTPALLGTFVILLANALGAYATVYALTTGNFNVLPIRIAAMVSGDISLDPNLASALAVVLVALMTLVTIVHQLLLKRSYHVSR